jgi:hypothetical protein
MNASHSRRMHRWLGSVVGAVALAAAGAGTVVASGSPAAAQPRLLAAVKDPVYGVTIDQVTKISTVVANIEKLPYAPTVRVVFTWSGNTPTAPSHYATAVTDLDAHGSVMGELLDSSFEKKVTVKKFTTDVKNYLTKLGSKVAIWEIGNEVNGNWTGTYSTVKAKLVEAYDDVHAAGDVSALTLYANEYAPHHCGDGTSELTPVQFSQTYVPSTVRDGISYVFESFYPTTCTGLGTLPSAAAVATEMEQLHQLYPNAKVGFGELGLATAVTSTTEARAKQIMAWGYGLDPGLSYYVGGYFWWYAYEDCFTGKKLLLNPLITAFTSEHTTLG